MAYEYHNCEKCGTSIEAKMENEWINTETQKPEPRQRVLIEYTSGSGDIRITMGWYVPHSTVRMTVSMAKRSHLKAEYNREDDCYYLSEQWVDQSREGDARPISVANRNGKFTVTRWMPLPKS